MVNRELLDHLSKGRDLLKCDTTSSKGSCPLMRKTATSETGKLRIPSNAERKEKMGSLVEVV